MFLLNHFIAQIIWCRKSLSGPQRGGEDVEVRRNCAGISDIACFLKFTQYLVSNNFIYVIGQALQEIKAKLDIKSVLMELTV